MNFASRSLEPRTGDSLPNQFGKFEILGHIATGGMAEIHLARAAGPRGFEKIVVIKRIRSELTADPEFVRMFLDEARIAATLQHSNIVQVHDIGIVGGEYFLAMEFLHGEDVSRIMKALQAQKRELPLEHAVQIASSVCLGLHYAHEKKNADGWPLGIVHRDVTPQNVFVTFDGGIKLVDFGIAKAAGRASRTRFGTLKGKVRYMSPEQALARPLDGRSDVFSVAIMLWEMTTGRRLYQGASDFEILKRIVETNAPPPSSVKFGYPHELERIVMKGLRRNRDERYATALEMHADLEAFSRERKLSVTAVWLSRFMRELFREKLDLYSAAQQSGGLLRARLAHAKASAEEPPWLEEEATVLDIRPPPPPRTAISVPPTRSYNAAPPPAPKRKRFVAAIAGLVAGSMGAAIVLWPSEPIQEQRLPAPVVVAPAHAAPPALELAPSPPVAPPAIKLYAAPIKRKTVSDRKRTKRRKSKPWQPATFDVVWDDLDAPLQ